VPGAEIVVHSATKYLGGQGAASAGCDPSTAARDWHNGSFHASPPPTRSLPGVVFDEIGPARVSVEGKVHLLRDLGSAASR